MLDHSATLGIFALRVKASMPSFTQDDLEVPNTKTISKASAALRENLTRVLDARKLTEPAFAKLAGLDQKTLWRALHGETEPTLATVSKIAKTVGVEPWMLLTPNMHPTNHPMLVSESERLLELYKKIETTQEAVAGFLRDSGNTGHGDL
jgi:DNA-binding phage protein